MRRGELRKSEIIREIMQVDGNSRARREAKRAAAGANARA